MKGTLRKPAKALTLREEIKAVEEQQAKLEREERIYSAILQEPEDDYRRFNCGDVKVLEHLGIIL